MKLKVLIQKYRKGDFTRYRGLARVPINYINTLPDNHEVNLAFMKYIESRDGVVTDDLDLCIEVANAYQRLEPPQLLDIIEIVEPDNLPHVAGGILLGFDIAFADHHSLLEMTDGLDFKISYNHLQQDDAIHSLRPILSLTSDYFQPKLNANGLFDDEQTAQYCLDVMMAMQKIRPGLWENESFVFEVKGIWTLNWQSDFVSGGPSSRRGSPDPAAS